MTEDRSEQGCDDPDENQVQRRLEGLLILGRVINTDQIDDPCYKYLKNTELIDKVYTSLKKGMPVPFEWAAKHENEWTLHYSLIIGLDVQKDVITIANPYGYIEEISIKDFLNRTSFEAYENMPILLKLGFAFGIFEKNAIFIIEKR